MYSLLSKFSEENKEKFNKEFILSRNDEEVLEYVRDIFKSLEILTEIEILEVSLQTDESTFGPIKSHHQYFKSIMPSRLNKIHYKLKITPSENVPMQQILTDEFEESLDPDDENTTKIEKSSNFTIIEKDLFINKLIDKSFYINEGIRYFLIYQIVDNSTYGTKNSVSLKSLLMPITVMRRDSLRLPSLFDTTKTFDGLPAYDVLLFAKRINPVLYVMGKYAYNSLVAAFPDSRAENIIIDRQNFKDDTLFEKFNSFFGVDIKFADDESTLIEEGRTVFKLKDKAGNGTCISVDTKQLENKDQNLISILGSLADIRTENKKKRFVFSYDNFMTPDFWIDKLSKFFTGNSDPIKKFDKIKTMLISLDRLMDDATRKILNIAEDDKKNTLSVIHYMIRNFESLAKEDNQDLDNKRIRLYEYQLYPLRKYFSDHIYRILNSPTRSLNVLERMFSNLSPMYIIKQTVVNELLRYYNSTNELNLFGCLLKYTFRGPQSINKTVSIYQRDLHESYTGRLSLVASSASDPGISGTLVPFLELYDGYFKKQDNV